jgi:hypothetical protein
MLIISHYTQLFPANMVTSGHCLISLCPIRLVAAPDVPLRRRACLSSNKSRSRGADVGPTRFGRSTVEERVDRRGDMNAANGGGTTPQARGS